jgi:hypothetical protein
VYEAEIFSERQKEALKFFSNDFAQCFQQIRHYDNEVSDSLKYTITVYVSIIGLSLGIYQIGVKLSIDLKVPSILMLSLIQLLGLTYFINILKHRVLFVKLTHYINEQRELFFMWMPKEFSNKSGMYTNSAFPNYFKWSSSQLWCSYIIALLNSIITGIIVYILHKNWIYAISICIILFLIYILSAHKYLKSKDKKSRNFSRT